MEDKAIIRQQAQLLYQQAPYSNGAIILVAILMFWLFSDHEHVVLLKTWSAIILGLSVLRLILWFVFTYRSDHNPPRKWINRYMLLTFIIGITWGAASIFYFLIDDIQINTLFYVLICGVITAGVPVLAAWFPAYLVYTIPQISMLTGVTLYQAYAVPNTQALSYFLLSALLFYYLMMTSMAKRSNRNIVDGLKLQEKNQALLDDLNWEVAQRESMIESRTTELREANQQLSENRAHMAKLSSAVEASPNGIMITNREGIIEYVNPRSEQISGYSLQESIGKTPRLFKSAFTTKGACKSMWRTIMDGQEWVGELENKRKNGEAYWARV
ncbi:MAG TPA: PAS domain S-box protein, partial [Methylophaga sp.]|nr:PAS domain S-box protein [Methylophaga sp.]